MLSETYNATDAQMKLSLSGLAGKSYELFVWNPSQLSSVKGGELEDVHPDQAALLVEFGGGGADSYVPQNVILNFVRSK